MANNGLRNRDYEQMIGKADSIEANGKDLELQADSGYKVVIKDGNGDNILVGDENGIELSKDAVAKEDFEVDGDLVVGTDNTDTMLVKSTSTFKENVTLDKDLSVKGNTSLGDSSSDTIDIAGTSTFAENATFEKDVTIKGDLNLEDNSGVGGIIKVDSATRPTEVKAGELWYDNGNSNLWYYDGTNDLPASDSRPSGLSDGDRWYNYEAGAVVEVYASIFDLNTSNDGSGGFLVTDGDRKTLGTKYGVAVYADESDSSNSKKSAFHIDPDENTAYITLYQKGNNGYAQTELQLKDDKRGYINNKPIMVLEYDPNVTHTEITDDATIKNYVTVPTQYGTGTKCDRLMVNIVRIGDVCQINGRLYMSNMSFDSENDDSILVPIKIMDFIRDQGWFDADIEVAGYGALTILYVTDSSDVRMMSELLFTRDKTDSSNPNQVVFYNGEAILGWNQTIEQKRWWFNVTFVVKDK